MRHLSRLRFFAGLAAMGATVLLMTPGVRVAKADDATEIERFLAQTESATSPGPTCNANPQAAERVHEASIQRAMAAMRARIAAMPEPSFDPARQEGVVTLNNRGFNYAGGQPFDFDPSALPKTP